ncbi:putative ubiquitinyl hydrolase 1 [Helianthus annuus]|nr:putative ubiquitinyl hydrolase 1 [Helianthus annuus]
MSGSFLLSVLENQLTYFQSLKNWLVMDRVKKLNYLRSELQFEPNVKCVHIDKRLSFEGSKLEDGDIICFQKVVHIKNTNTMRYPDVVSFLEYVHNRQMIESQNKSTIN